MTILKAEYVYAAMVMVVGLAGTAAAQAPTVVPVAKSRSTGIFVGVGYEGTAVTTKDGQRAGSGNGTTTESGPGFGVTVGWGFTPRLAMYGALSGAGIHNATPGLENYGFGHFDVGVRVHFRAPEKKVVPFVGGGWSARALVQRLDGDELDATGFGVVFGGGVNVHFTPVVAFTAGVTWGIGSLGDWTLNGDALSGAPRIDAMSTRVQVGMVFFPMNRR